MPRRVVFLFFLLLLLAGFSGCSGGKSGTDVFVAGLPRFSVTSAAHASGPLSLLTSPAIDAEWRFVGVQKTVMDVHGHNATAVEVDATRGPDVVSYYFAQHSMEILAYAINGTPGNFYPPTQWPSVEAFLPFLPMRFSEVDLVPGQLYATTWVGYDVSVEVLDALHWRLLVTFEKEGSLLNVSYLYSFAPGFVVPLSLVREQERGGHPEERYIWALVSVARNADSGIQADPSIASLWDAPGAGPLETYADHPPGGQPNAMPVSIEDALRFAHHCHAIDFGCDGTIPAFFEQHPHSTVVRARAYGDQVTVGQGSLRHEFQYNWEIQVMDSDMSSIRFLVQVPRPTAPADAAQPYFLTRGDAGPPPQLAGKGLGMVTLSVFYAPCAEMANSERLELDFDGAAIDVPRITVGGVLQVPESLLSCALRTGTSALSLRIMEAHTGFLLYATGCPSDRCPPSPLPGRSRFDCAPCGRPAVTL
ncbi:MAG: hypothetical protein V4510_09140 [bacterium]